MTWISERLQLDSGEVCLQIEELLRHKLAEMAREGIVIGLSGGLDSAVVAYLSARAVGKDRVMLLNLPDRDSKTLHQQHARLIAQELGAGLQTRDLTPILKSMGVYDLLPIRFLPGQRLKARFRPTANSFVARGNAYAMAKHRLRMALLYQHAEVHNLMVVGAANRTEWLTGTFSQWGCDQCADVMPILQLFRSQLGPLAEYLGVPEAVRTKPADPDILPGVDNKEELLGSFSQTDQILWGLENGIGQDELVRLFGKTYLARIERLIQLSRPMRESPYTTATQSISALRSLPTA
jgi:NAD+ synthase